MNIVLISEVQEMKTLRKLKRYLKVSEQEFLAAAQEAEGMNEIYLRIFLAQSEYEM